MDEKLSYYLNKLHQRNNDDAYFSLLHIDAAQVTQLIDAYHVETDVKVKVQLIDIIWQHRLPECLEFLGAVLQDKHAEIWKAALDGIVGIGGQRAVKILETEKQRLYDKPNPPLHRIEWVEEALLQAKNT
jgi:hypothetical protein